jgi:hypothetical protein
MVTRSIGRQKFNSTGDSRHSIYKDPFFNQINRGIIPIFHLYFGVILEELIPPRCMRQNAPLYCPFCRTPADAPALFLRTSTLPFSNSGRNPRISLKDMNEYQ